MKKILLTFLFFTLSSQAHAIETSAKHAYMIDAQTGAVLLDKEGYAAMVPSSMSKLMTLYIAFERLKEGRIKMEDTLTVSEKAWRMQGSKTFVKLGDQVSVDNLIHGIVVQSGNDACIVIAEGLSGSEEAFVVEMNKTAKKLGLTQSHFVNATGWPDEGHVMSARDLAILSKHIIEEFPDMYPLFSIKEYTFNNITQMNRDRLLGNDIGVDGLKTGHTDAGGYGIALSANHDGRRLILVINGLASDNDRVKEGDILLRWGFREFTNKTLVSGGVKVAAVPVWFGSQKEVGLVAEKDVVVTVPAGESAETQYTLRYNSPVPAPIAKDAHIADLVVSSNGVEQTIPLVAADDVAKLSGISKAWAVIKNTLGMK
jgi:D-alanyl-D-alanine carboxypeptidase (penicillin-binding protein 5/6)